MAIETQSTSSERELAMIAAKACATVIVEKKNIATSSTLEFGVSFPPKQHVLTPSPPYLSFSGMLVSAAELGVAISGARLVGSLCVALDTSWHSSSKLWL